MAAPLLRVWIMQLESSALNRKSSWSINLSCTESLWVGLGKVGVAKNPPPGLGLGGLGTLAGDPAFGGFGLIVQLASGPDEASRVGSVLLRRGSRIGVTRQVQSV